jgi:hypothetical protein
MWLLALKALQFDGSLKLRMAADVATPEVHAGKLA